MKKYRVTCLNCKDSDVLTIDQDNQLVMHFQKSMLTNILSARWRGDDSWGYECRCGNDNRLAASESKEFDTLVQGDPITLKRIRESLKIPDASQFSVEVA